MIKKIFLIFFFLNIFNVSVASIKSEIITNFKKIDNLSFDFKQSMKYAFWSDKKMIFFLLVLKNFFNNLFWIFKSNSLKKLKFGILNLSRILFLFNFLE